MRIALPGAGAGNTQVPSILLELDTSSAAQFKPQKALSTDPFGLRTQSL